VTDAHVVLGRIGAEQLAGGQLHIDPGAAEAAVSRVGKALGLDVIGAAGAILRVANSNMERAIRAVSVERGEDPREFPLVAFGGCGGLHACEIAEELGVETVIVPRLAGALSALGMLLADRTRDYSIGALGVSDHEQRFRKLEKQARQDVRGSVLGRFADVRYAGQSYELTIPWGTDFHQAHQRAYGYSDAKRATEIVTLRVRAVVRVEKPSLRAEIKRLNPESARRVWIAGRWCEVTTGPRESLGIRPKVGPALITDYGSTTLVPPGWSMRLDAAGSLILRQGGSASLASSRTRKRAG
jgi:N-methylhydantoinase A